MPTRPHSEEGSPSPAERALSVRKGPDLFQRELFAEVRAESPSKPRQPRAAKCPKCVGLGLETIRYAAPGGRWKCGRGHGLIPPG